jgi:hypothetical protein
MHDYAQVPKGTLAATANDVSSKYVWKARERCQYLTRIDPDLRSTYCTDNALAYYTINVNDGKKKFL